jgi:hypothetical protein
MLSVLTDVVTFQGRDLRPQPRRDQPRRSKSLVRQTTGTNPASPTIPIVFLSDDILLGSIRALQNERQLCKLSVDYLIDATNMRPDELARKANIGARLPCQCGHTHSRCTLTLEFDSPLYSSTSSNNDPHSLTYFKTRDASRTHLEQLFSAVNRFIGKAQQESKRILIYGFELTSNSPLAVIAIQYLMLNTEELSLNQATHRIHRLFPIPITKQQQYPIMDKRFQDYLKQLDRNVSPRKFNMNRSNSSNGADTNEYRPASTITNRDSLSANTSEQSSLTSWTTSPTPINRYTTHSFFPARSAWDI